jgi:hypothetical protein
MRCLCCLPHLANLPSPWQKTDYTQRLVTGHGKRQIIHID